ncbi:MAG: iron-containing alcohol dehydrogenase [Verrucomicrobiales bacterium]
MTELTPLANAAIPLGSLAAFDYQPRTRVLFGVDAVEQTGELAKELGARRVLLVTDPGLVKAGHPSRVAEILRRSGIEVVTFDKSAENPTTGSVDECVQVARAEKIDFFIGLGGGSAMDTAKGCNFILTNGGVMKDYWGVAKAKKPMLPLIAIPTTAGTGSECQSFALIADEKTHAKMACGDPKAAARIAILDPLLTMSQPQRVTACTGIDAMAHAVETAVTRKRNALSLMYSHEAFKMCVASFPEVAIDGQNADARGRMLLAAAFAGTAIENSMLGAAHSAANPLTAHFDIVHGQAVGMMLPHVIRFNAKDPVARRAYAELASAPEIACLSEGEEYAVEALISRVEELLDLAKMPRSLLECGVDPNTIPIMAEESAKQWTATFNPRRIVAADFVELYQAALEPRQS